MKGRTWTLVAASLVGGLVVWWATGDRWSARDATVLGEVAVERELEPEREAEPDQPQARASEFAERERVAEPKPLALEVTHRFTGRVVDQTRRPVRGARVELRSGDRELPEVASDADGRFTIEAALGGVERTGKAQLLARDESGRRGRRPAWFGVAREGEVIERDLGTIVLLETHALRVRVVDGGAPVADATLRLATGHERSLFEERATDVRGEALFEGLEAGPVHLTASTPAREGRVKLFVPEEASALVELEPLGTVSVIVVDAESDAPVANAELGVRESYHVPAVVGRQDRMAMGGEYLTYDFDSERRFQTDADGRVVVNELSNQALYRLSVAARGYEDFPGSRSSGPRLKSGPEPLRVELTPQPPRTVRWPIVEGELFVPPDETPLALRFPAGALGFGDEPELPGPARVEGAEVVVEQVAGRANLFAETPDGGIARLWIDEHEVLGKELSFRRARRIEVLVHDPHGAPVEGARAIARSQGNNDLGPEVTTDAEGHALIEGLYGRLAEVYVMAPGEKSRGRVAGTVDLDAGDGLVEATLERPRSCIVRLRVLLDGEPRLPARFSVSGRPRARVVEELPGRGELLIEVSDVGPGDDAQLSVHAAGFLVATVQLAFPAGGGEATADLALERAALLVARVVLPAGGRVDLKPQQLGEETGAWTTPPTLRYFNGLSWPSGPDGSFVFEGLSPGSWRVFDERSKLASDAAVLAPGARELQVELDLAGIEWVSGRVPVPGDREVELSAWHPWLAADKGTGRMSVRGGRDGVVLQLTPGGELRLPTPDITGTRAWLRVARYAGEPEGAPLAWHPAPVVDGVARCGLPRGRWNLWIDPGKGFAPFVLRDVQVEGVTELPAPVLSLGSSIRLTILVPEGQAAPRVHLYAWHPGEPAYDRWKSSRDGTELVLPGFGPGRFRIRANTVMDRRGLPEREIELDGVNDFELELDLR